MEEEVDRSCGAPLSYPSSPRNLKTPLRPHFPLDGVQRATTRPTDRPGLRWATDNAISEEIKERSRPAFQLARVW